MKPMVCLVGRTCMCIYIYIYPYIFTCSSVSIYTYTHLYVEVERAREQEIERERTRNWRVCILRSIYVGHSWIQVTATAKEGVSFVVLGRTCVIGFGMALLILCLFGKSGVYQWYSTSRCFVRCFFDLSLCT